MQIAFPKKTYRDYIKSYKFAMFMELTIMSEFVAKEALNMKIF